MAKDKNKKQDKEPVVSNTRDTMVGATQGPLTLGGGGGWIPAFPTSLSNINPEEKTSPIMFAGGGRAEMGIGGANVSYPSSFNLTGLNSPLEMGNRDFGAAQQLISPQTPSMFGTVPFSPFTPREERMTPVLSSGLTPLSTESSMPLFQGNATEGYQYQGPVSLRREGAMALPQTAVQRGLERVENPYGFAYVTPEQKKNLASAESRDLAKNKRMAQFQNTLAEIRANKPKLEQERMIASQRGDAERMARLLESRKIDLAEQLQKERERGGSGRDVFARLEQARVRSELARQRASNIGTGRRTPFFRNEAIKMPTGETAYSGSMGQFTILKPYRSQTSPITQSQSYRPASMGSDQFMGYSPFTSEENPFGSVFGGLNTYRGGT